MVKIIVLALVLSGVVTPGAAAVQDPAPIFQPGAPGDAAQSLTPAQSVALGQTRYTADDVRFMQHMIVHHAQAVEMGDLIDGRTDHAGITLMGSRISMSQTTEIAMMRTWLTRRGEALAMQTDHTGHHAGHAMPAAPSETPVMPGMLSPAQMARLAAADGAAFDRLYLDGMILHHQGAIDMVEALLRHPGAGEDPELSEFLSSVIADQSAEIARMGAMRAALD